MIETEEKFQEYYGEIRRLAKLRKSKDFTKFDVDTSAEFAAKKFEEDLASMNEHIDIFVRGAEREK